MVATMVRGPSSVWLAGLALGAACADAGAQWAVTSLHPSGAAASVAYGEAGTQQVGSAYVGGQFDAGLWSGAAASWVDLNPAGSTSSYAEWSTGTQQVGAAMFNGLF